MSATTILELKQICQIFEGMEKMYVAKESKQKTLKVNTVNSIENPSSLDADEKVDYWSNEIDWDCISDENDRVLVINETFDKRKNAVNQKWSKEQKQEWLASQMCWNCERKGHLQGQCDTKWQPHCVKCGNKSVNNMKDCSKCSGNVKPSVSKGAQN